ncbi:MAG: sigma 54-interacting transcriptional regulator [Planctomycetota bacterium]
MTKHALDTLQGLLNAVGAPQVLDGLASLFPDAAVFAVDAERTVVYWSEGAERLLGYRAEEALGNHCLKTNRCVNCMAGCGIQARGAVQDVPLELYRADGSTAQVSKTARGFFAEDGAFLGGVEVLTPRDPPAAIAPAPREGTEFHGLLTGDAAMLEVFQIVENVARTDATVLVRGESGSGKELVARAVHAESERAAGPFVAVNCAALAPSLLESQLFGHVKGAFTGAVNAHEGLFRRAHGGTLFLDEVAELPLDLQAKLLRVLEEGELTPVGGTRPLPVDVRVVAATHRSLRAEVRAGRFREDLMYRLRVVPLFIPPLRERRGDVELLLWRFVAQHNRHGPRRVERVAPEAMRALLDHPWPGNIRELKNVVQYAFAVGRGAELLLSELPPEFREGAPAPARRAPHDDEARRIRDALAASHGHVGEAAALLGMSRPTFWRKRKKYGLG